VAFVVGVFAGRLFMGALSLSEDVFSLTTFAYNLFYWGLSGLGQEIIFRGLILFSFYRWKGERVALLVYSAFYGCSHIGVSERLQPFVYRCRGFILGVGGVKN
jgi:membrane protease YdiL (CAAX protease family)